MFRYYMLSCIEANNFLRTTLVLTAIAPVVCIGTLVQTSRWSWKPVDMALSLDGPVKVDIPFTTNTPGEKRYLLSFVPHGAEVHRDDEKDVAPWLEQSEIASHLHIVADSKPVDFILQAGGYEGYDSRAIATFLVPSGQNCSLHLEGPPVPAVMHPLKLHLTVEVLSNAQQSPSLVPIGLLMLLNCIMLIAGTAIIRQSVELGKIEYAIMLDADAKPKSTQTF